MSEQKEAGVGHAEGRSGCAGLLVGLAIIGAISAATTFIGYAVVTYLL